MRLIRPLDVSHPGVSHNVGLIVFFFFGFFVNEANSLLNFSADFLTYILIILYTLLFNISAFVVGPCLFRHHLDSFCDFFPRGWSIAFIYLPFLIGILLHIFYFFMIQAIPLLHEDAGLFRIEAKKGFGSIVILGTVCFYISTFFSVLKTMAKKTITSQIELLANFSIAFMLILFVGFRSPAFFLIIFMIYSVIVNSKKYRQLPFRYFLLIIFSFVGAIVIGIFRDDGGLIDIFGPMIWSFYVNIHNLDLLINFFPLEGFYFGSTYFNDLTVALPFFDSVFLGVKLPEILGLSFVGESISVTIIGESFVNFGIVGVLLVPVALGITAHYFHSTLRRSAMRKCILMVLCIFFFRIVTGGLMPIMIFFLIPFLVVLLLLNFLRFVK
jgi:hypothetical protein